MIINIKDRATTIKLGYSLFIIIYLALLVFSLIFTFLPNYLFEIVLSIACLSLFVFYMLMGHTYLYFNDEADKFIFRYQMLNPFITNRNAIEIPKKQFLKFEIKKSLFGLKKQIVLYQKTKDGIAKYSPVGLSSLKKSEIKSIEASLSKYIS